MFVNGPAKAEESIHIGVLVSLTGNWAEIGTNVRRGISLAADEINASGGVLGKQLKFDFEDTQEEVSGSKVVSAYRALRSKGVNLFIGPTGVPGEQAIVPVAKNDAVVIISSNTGPQIQKYSSHFFNSAGTNEQTTRASARQAIQNGVRRAAVFSSLQPWEADQAEFFTEEFKSLGGEIVATVAPQPDVRDLRNEAMILVRSKPDAIFFAVFNQVAIAAQAVENLGYKGLQFAALLDGEHIKTAQGALENTQLFQFKSPSQTFKDSLQKKYTMEPVYPIDFTFDAVTALVSAIRLAGIDEPRAVANALHKVRFVGSAGKETTFGDSGLIEREIELAVVRNETLVSFQVEEIKSPGTLSH